jgi:hypothetical protein
VQIKVFNDKASLGSAGAEETAATICRSIREKGQAVKSCLEGPITPMAPASILRTHPNTTVFLDQKSSALLDAETTAK